MLLNRVVLVLNLSDYLKVLSLFLTVFDHLLSALLTVQYLILCCHFHHSLCIWADDSIIALNILVIGVLSHSNIEIAFVFVFLLETNVLSLENIPINSGTSSKVFFLGLDDAIESLEFLLLYWVCRQLLMSSFHHHHRVV